MRGVELRRHTGDPGNLYCMPAVHAAATPLSAAGAANACACRDVDAAAAAPAPCRPLTPSAVPATSSSDLFHATDTIALISDQIDRCYVSLSRGRAISNLFSGLDAISHPWKIGNISRGY
eukprot:6175660-Pleurochrysis_carterae.AAC.4